MEKIKAVQIGFGRWGKRLALEAEKYTDLSIADRESFGQQLANPEIQAVFIATPINTHFDITMQALKEEKNVFLEKPGTDSSKKLSELTREAEKRNLVLQIGYEFAFAPNIEEMKKMLAAEKVSRILFEWKKMGTFDFHPVINLLVHELSILKAIGVWPVEIVKYEENLGEHNPDSIHIEAKSGEIDITFDIDRASEIKEKVVTLVSNKNTLLWKDGRQPLVEDEVRAFVDSIKNKTQPKTDGNFGVDILKTIESIPYRS